MNPEMDRTALMNQRLEIATRIASRTAGLLHLGSGLAGEIVDVVERMHGTIERFPSPLGKVENDRTTGITGMVYRGIRRCFGIVADSLGSGARGLTRIAGEDESPSWVTTRGIINGVFGDALESKGNPLAQTMRLVSRQGATESPTMVIFLHGLCMTELGWQRGEFAEFEAWCRTGLKAKTAHIRYNSGRRISINGRELSGLLEATVKNEDVQQLILVGHSMGGLLVRSAGHYGRELKWLERLTHVAMLGTPHHGAPLERLGNFANGLLKKTPYTTPLAHLGDLRSAGIKDLRFTNLVDEDWEGRAHDLPHPEGKQEVPLIKHVNYLMVAATRSVEVREPVWRSKDDLLVPVASAWGLANTGEDLLNHSSVRRELISNIDHMALLGHREVMQITRTWLQDTSV